MASTSDMRLSSEVSEWLSRRSSRSEQWPTAGLVAAKENTRVSVVIPTRNEQATIGAIVRTIRRELIDRAPVVDEVIVVDSRSTDATAQVATEAGAFVVAQDDVLPELPRCAGKGEALWKGLATSTGDVVVFIDGDLRDFSPHFVTGLLGPLLTDPSVGYVKGFYRRPLERGSVVEPAGGGRVTELMARPLLNAYWPELAGFVQPLAGEYAGRRTVLSAIPFVTHYGVEIGQLIDLVDGIGLDAMAQVDLGCRRHRHQDTQSLGRMAGQILLTVLDRLERSGRVVATGPPSNVLAQFVGGGVTAGIDREIVLTDVATVNRPPLNTVRVEEAGVQGR